MYAIQPPAPSAAPRPFSSRARAAALFTALACAACGAPAGDGDGVEAGGGAGATAASGGSSSAGPGPDCVPPPELEAVVVPAECLGGPCQYDQDCDGGSRCNGTLIPPTCQALYCGVVGSPCDDSALCENDLECTRGLCRACDTCGDRCWVHFQTDDEHCGCCDNPVPPGGECVDGAPTCPSETQLCGGSCIAVQDDQNCGACGATCGSLAGEVGTCHLPGSVGPNFNCGVESSEPQSCGELCAAWGMECDDRAYLHAVYGNCCCEGVVAVLSSCDQAPPADQGTVSCGGTYVQEFSSLHCSCLPTDPGE